MVTKTSPLISQQLMYTVSFLQFLHYSKLKRHPSYLANISNRRIDHFVNVLLKIEEDQYLAVQKKNNDGIH